MKQYILRLDDASDYMDVDKWQQMENLLDKYAVKPLVGIIPENRDASLIQAYKKASTFWTEKVLRWQAKDWEFALHGCYHKYITENGGMNPVNKRSEFAGVSLEEQCAMIRHGNSVLKQNGITATIFFAPSHTFDESTLQALKRETNIRIISDTIANDVYYQDGFYFIPQQSGRARRLPFNVCTFCYHPNAMQQKDFEMLEIFFKQNRNRFVCASDVVLKKRKMNLLDLMLRKLYFIRR